MTITMVRKFVVAAVAAAATIATLGAGTAVAGKPPAVENRFAGNYSWAGWYGGPWTITISRYGSIRGEYAGPAGLSELKGTITDAGVFSHWFTRIDGRKTRTVTLGGYATSDAQGNLLLDYPGIAFQDVWYRQ